MNQSASSTNSDISYLCLSSVSNSDPASSTTKPQIIKGFSKDQVSTYVRPSIEKHSTSSSSEQYIYPWRSQPRRKNFIVGSERDVTTKTDLDTKQPCSSYDIDVFNNSDEELVFDSTSETSDEVDWDDIDDSSMMIDDEKFIFCRINTTSSPKSSTSSLTHLLRQQSFQKNSMPAGMAAVQMPPVLNARACHQHIYQTEFAGSLPNHLQWERRVNDKRLQAKYQHLSCRAEALVMEGWHEALDSRLWSCHW